MTIPYLEWSYHGISCYKMPYPEERSESHRAAVLLLGLVAIASSWALYRLCYGRQSSDIEPPTVYGKVPIVGHIWNMVWGRFEYFVKLR